jgi:DNA-directed RNA polymerase specialized sigma24 family protein
MTERIEPGRNDSRSRHDALVRAMAEQRPNFVAAGLKPEYAQALERIEVDGEALRAFATEVGISASNAAVRVFRAREALRRGLVATCGACARDRCVDCTCGGAP